MMVNEGDEDTNEHFVVKEITVKENNKQLLLQPPAKRKSFSASHVYNYLKGLQNVIKSE
jgi:hypothetical protein